jgi:hypothetical protein
MFYLDLFTQGWKYLWRSKFVWLYSVFGVVAPIFQLLIRSGGISWACLFLILALPLIALSLIAWAGLIRTGYLLSEDQRPDLENTWMPVRSLGVVAVLGIVAFIIVCLVAIFLFLLTAGYISAFTSIKLRPEVGFAIFLGYLEIPLGSMSTFFYCSSVIRSMGISKGIRHALELIVAYLGTVTVVNIMLWGLTIMVTLIVSLVVLFIQTGFSFDFISTFGFSLYNLTKSTPLFILLISLCWLIITPYQTMVATLVYVGLVKRDQKGGR